MSRGDTMFKKILIANRGDQPRSGAATKSNQFSELSMANVPARDSGLPGGMVIFASNKGTYADDPLVKVSNVRGKMTDTGDTFAVSISMRTGRHGRCRSAKGLFKQRACCRLCVGGSKPKSLARILGLGRLQHSRFPW